MIDQFTKEQFKQALPKKKSKETGELYSIFTEEFPLNEEWCFATRISDPNFPKELGKIRIVVRSSVSVKTGISDGCGENSIRIYVERLRYGKWKAISKGPDTYTNRKPGWENRLKKKIQEVYIRWRSVFQSFTDVDDVFMSKQPATFGKVFAKNTETGEFRWLS